jgi:hypothetical protein
MPDKDLAVGRRCENGEKNSGKVRFFGSPDGAERLVVARVVGQVVGWAVEHVQGQASPTRAISVRKWKKDKMTFYQKAESGNWSK